ncbi:MAG: YceI family protein, partial [Gaiellaceae bacterium]
MSTTEQQVAGTFTADPVHSHVGFEVPYAVATFSGEVTDFTATLVDGHLEGSAKIESIQLKDENLTAHVLSPEFFDAERHPVLTF